MCILSLPQFLLCKLRIISSYIARIKLSEGKNHSGGWRDGSAVKDTFCSSRGPRIDFLHPQSSSQSSVTPVPGDQCPLLASEVTRHANDSHTEMQAKHAHT